ncbi:MAG: DUF4254 domain-containing protein [Bacteroidetes bacterium]|nr:DUF4254 domain-containing protein [Bacteroidota bacterium]MBS1757463.1 DUF4254 domain-containing protein [Bacteroidota bacterium]
MQIGRYIEIFQQAINEYHLKDSVDTAIKNPYPKDSLEHLLYLKNWVDTVQWHLEDIIRNPNINPGEALVLKRRIDASNQHRTDLVEYIDSWFLKEFEGTPLKDDATYNTETPAWAIDRLSILELKIYHMTIEAERKDASIEHQKSCAQKLAILLTQRVDLSTAIQQLINDISRGKKFMKVYKQMKMYNDESLNPVLYNQKK